MTHLIASDKTVAWFRGDAATLLTATVSFRRAESRLSGWRQAVDAEGPQPWVRSRAACSHQKARGSFQPGTATQQKATEPEV